MITQEEIDRRSAEHDAARRAHVDASHISVGYAILMFLFPAIFVWRLLGRGYETRDRVIWFCWLGVWFLCVLARIGTVRAV